LIEEQWQAHERLQQAGVFCPHIFHRNGAPILAFRKAWRNACAAAGVPGTIRMTAAGRLSATLCGPRV
jgi:hypothetical protein